MSAAGLSWPPARQTLATMLLVEGLTVAEVASRYGVDLRAVTAAIKGKSDKRGDAP